MSSGHYTREIELLKNQVQLLKDNVQFLEDSNSWFSLAGYNPVSKLFGAIFSVGAFGLLVENGVKMARR